MPVDVLTAFDAALDSLTLFESQYEDVEILAALLNEQYDERGNPEDIVDITFRIRGRPGMFQVHPHFDLNWQAQAFFQIGLKHATVEAIYQELPSVNALSVTTPTPIVRPLPGVAVPV